jgi:tripartite-type tricarboxylate transporter receptor subunit TctC
LSAILARPDVKEKFEKIGLPVTAEGPAAFMKRVEHEVPMYKAVIDKAGLKIQ